MHTEVIISAADVKSKIIWEYKRMVIPKDHTNDKSSDLLNKSCTHTDSITSFSGIISATCS